VDTAAFGDSLEVTNKIWHQVVTIPTIRAHGGNHEDDTAEPSSPGERAKDLLEAAEESGLDKDAEDLTDAANDVVKGATQSVLDTAEETLAKYRAILIGLCIPIGLLACFFGYFLFTPILFVTGFLLGGGFFYFAVKATLEGTSAESWGTITAAVLGGLVVGVVAIKAVAVGIFLLGTLHDPPWFGKDRSKIPRYFSPSQLLKRGSLLNVQALLSGSRRHLSSGRPSSTTKFCQATHK